MAANANPGSNAYTVNQISPNKYGAPPNNSNRQPLGEANGFITQDYTGRLASATKANPNAGATSDIPSPLALTGATSAQLIVIPPNATSVTLIGSATFSFSETGTVGSALSQYVAVPATTAITLSTARQQNLYVEGTGNLSFFFQYL
jgi:hypothetical protein